MCVCVCVCVCRRKGPLYLVTSVALHTETQEQFVHYRSLYASASNPLNLSFVRPLNMFLEEIEWAREGEQKRRVKRFTLVREMSAAEIGRGGALANGAGEDPAIANSSSSSSTPAASSAAASSAPSSAASSSAPTPAAPAVPASTAPCSNPSCPTPHAATKSCARCKSGIAYCSVACQKADWSLSHKARCFSAEELTLQSVRDSIKNKGTLAYVDALRALSRMQALRLPEAKLAAAVESAVRTEIRSKMFDVTSLYKNARAHFTGDGEPSTTYARTMRVAMEWAPRCLPPPSAPLVVLWLGARDSNEGATDWRHLSNSVFGASRAVDLFLVGPPSTPQKEGLSSAPASQSFGSLKVRRIVGLYPTVAAQIAAIAPAVHVVCAFNAGLDAAFDTWAPAIDRVLGTVPPPLLVVSGYSTDASSLQDEEILRTLGAEIVVPTRRSPHGFALMQPHVSNHHITITCGRANAADVATEPKQRAEQIATIKKELMERGFDLR